MPNIKALGLKVSDKIFSHFPYISLCKHVGEAIYNLNKLGRSPLGDAKYQISTV